MKLIANKDFASILRFGVEYEGEIRYATLRKENRFFIYKLPNHAFPLDWFFPIYTLPLIGV